MASLLVGMTSDASSGASSATGNGGSPTSADSDDQASPSPAAPTPSTSAPAPAPTATGTTTAPVVTAAPVQGPADGVIATNTTIGFVVNANNDPAAPAAPNAAELATLEENTFTFFNQTLFNGFTESYVSLTRGDFTDMAIAGGWSINFFTETGFTPMPTTDEVKVVIENADYSDYIINYVIPSGPYFRFSSGLQLDSEASVKTR